MDIIIEPDKDPNVGVPSSIKVNDNATEERKDTGSGSTQTTTERKGFHEYYHVLNFNTEAGKKILNVIGSSKTDLPDDVLINTYFYSGSDNTNSTFGTSTYYELYRWYMDYCCGIDPNIRRALLANGSTQENTDCYLSNPYSGDTKQYKVFHRDALYNEQKTPARTTGFNAQNGNTDNLKQFWYNLSKAVMAMYMLKHGDAGITQFLSDYELFNDTYKDYMTRAAHNMWGEWIPSTSIHRGLDFCITDKADIAAGNYQPVHLLCTSVFKGFKANDLGKNYSACFESTNPKAFIYYVHCDFDDLKVNATYNAGTRIGTESWNGYQSTGRTTYRHLHLEFTSSMGYITPRGGVQASSDHMNEHKKRATNPMDTAETIASDMSLSPYNRIRAIFDARAAELVKDYDSTRSYTKNILG